MSGIAAGSAQIMRTVIVMSLTGSVIALLLFALKPLVRDRLPKLFQYYMWLAALTALLLPISRIVILPEPQATSGGQAVSLTPIHDIVRESFFAIDASGANGARPDRSVPLPELAGDREDAAEQRQPLAAATAMFAVWLLGAAAFAGQNVARYMRFSRRLKKRFAPASADETAMLISLLPKGRVPSLYRSPLAPTPMLIGIIRPSIVLPDETYTGTQLRNILLHELTHLRRRDVLMKWLSMLAGAIHWFNPIAYFVRREIGASCELACDEIIISTLDRNGKQNYGDTLIAAVAASAFPQTRLSTTMSEDKRAIKERLGSIMKYKSFPMSTIILSCVLLVVVICGAFFLGAASGIGRDAAPKNAPGAVDSMVIASPNAPDRFDSVIPSESDNAASPNTPDQFDSVRARDAVATTPSESDYATPGPVIEHIPAARPTTGIAYAGSVITDVALLTGEIYPLGFVTEDANRFAARADPDTNQWMHPVYTWKSSDESVFTVDSSGKVTAVGKGVAMLSVFVDLMLEDEIMDYASGECVIRVIGSLGDPEPGKDSGTQTSAPNTAARAYITYADTTMNDITLIKGDHAPLGYKIVSGNGVSESFERTATWKSSNEDVFTVNSSGTVTAADVGDATLTATIEFMTSDGDIQQATAECNVRVRKN